MKGQEPSRDFPSMDWDQDVGQTEDPGAGAMREAGRRASMRTMVYCYHGTD